MGSIKPLHIVIILVLTLGVRVIVKKIFDKSVHRGDWYTVNVPEGWKKEFAEDEVIFSSPELDLYTELPEAKFSIYSKKTSGMFIDDLFPQILDRMKRERGRILDSGELKIDGQVARWVLFLYEEHPKWMVLSFFLVDDFNRFTRLQFSAQAREFKVYRPEFEKFKASLKFKKFL